MQFNSTIKKVKALTFANLFDVEKSNDLQENAVRSVNRNVLQRFIVSYQAGRQVDFVSAAKCEVLSVPISLFFTDKTIRTGSKSSLVKCILDYVNMTPLTSIHITPEESQYVVDTMHFVHKKHITDDIMTFLDFAERMCEDLLQLPCARLDLDGDYYEQTSTKDSTGKRRAAQSATCKKQKTVPKAITPDTPFPRGDKEFKNYLSLKENSTSLHNLIGETLMKKAPHSKTVVASGVFKSRTEVQASGLSRDRITELECRVIVEWL